MLLRSNLFRWGYPAFGVARLVDADSAEARNPDIYGRSMAEVQSSILIVDDDAEDLASVEKTLRSLGSELLSVKDPHEVLPSVYRHRPDVVIVDALLPGLSGFDLCKQIKSDAQLKGTQVLILTGVYLRQQYRHEALQQFKADAFLTKPFRPPELQRIVVQLLARKTRLPQSTFLKRMGLPASGESKKRGLLGRLFGRGDSEPEVETVRIAPLARDRETAPAPVIGSKVQKPEGTPATSTVTNLEANTVAIEKPPPAPMPQPDGSPVEPKPMATEDRLEAPPTPHPWLEPAIALPEGLPLQTEPTPDPTLTTAPMEEATAEGEPRAGEEAKEETTGEAGPEPLEVAPGPDSTPEDETAPPMEAAPDESELSAGAELEAPPATEGEGVIWVEPDTRSQDLTLDEIAARTEEAEAGSSETEAEPTPASEAQADPPVETPAPTEPGSSVSVRRPRFRVGDVPIYDESDFLRELKR
ncbi:MAG: response regulator, partial [Vicinamibacteria bacterium]